MKTRTLKHSGATLVLGVLLGLGSRSLTFGQTGCCLVLPTTSPGNLATLAIPDPPWDATADTNAVDNSSYFTVQVSAGIQGVPAANYLGWCIDVPDIITLPLPASQALLYSSCDTNLNQELPAYAPATDFVGPDVWNQINYILNHKNGAYFWDVQIALWNLIGGPVPSFYTTGSPFPPTDTNAVSQLLADAATNAATWQLPCGSNIAVVVEVQPASAAMQLLIIEVPCTCSAPTVVPTGGTVGQTFVSPPTVPGGTNYTITSGSLPPGLVLNPTTGDITGTPTTPGTYTFTETVTDSTGTTTTLPPTTIIIAPPLAGVFVSEEIACLQPTNNCAPFAKLAAGIKGLEDPGFCYQITVTNSGASALTNLSVVDSQLGDVTTNLFAAPTVVLPPGGVATAYFKAAWSTNTTNTVTASGQSITNGATVTASDGTVALVDLASLVCNVMVTAPCDLDGVPNNNHVLLPGCGASCSVQFDVQVCNTGQADLTAVVLSSPALAVLGCGLPAPFTLPVGSCSNFQCSATLTCPGQALPVNVTVAAKASASAGACAYDMSSTNIVDVAAAGSGLVECAAGSANVCGAVLRDCAANGNLVGAPGLAGVVVTLKNTAGYTVAATVTDTNGAWCFNQEPDGVYTVVVTPPAGYQQTVDPDATLDNQTSVTVTGCLNVTGVNFGYTGSAPAVTLLKTGPAAANCGDTITYTFAVTNTGNTCFSGLQVSDPMFGGVIFNPGAVTPGQGFVFTTNYVVKLTDPTNLVNTATATGRPPVGNPVTAPSTWTVAVTPCVPLTLACSGGAGQAGVAYASALLASGGRAPYMFSLVGGSLPPGLTLDLLTGAITGTPTNAGTFSFRAQVVDAMGVTAQSVCTAGCVVSAAATWQFSAPSGPLGVAQAYTVNGLTITAYGFDNSGSPAALYGKNAGGDESGLGINGAPDSEIGTTNFIQLDLTQVIASGAQNALLTIGSVQAGEGYNLYGSSAQGVLGTLLGSGATDFTPFPIPSYPQYPFVSVRASAANVLLDALSVTLPATDCTIAIAAAAPPPCTTSVCGSVLLDCNADGNLTGDSGLSGVTVLLETTNGVPVATNTTDSAGAYCFTGMTSGTYVVSLVVPTNYALTTGVVTNTWKDASGEPCWQDNEGNTHWCDTNGLHRWTCPDGSQHYRDSGGRQYCAETTGKTRLSDRECDRDARDDSAGKTCWQGSDGRTHWQDDHGRDCWKDDTGCVHRKDSSGNECWKDAQGDRHWLDCDGKHHWKDSGGKRYCDNGSGGSMSEDDTAEQDCGGSTGRSTDRQVVVQDCGTVADVNFGLAGGAPAVTLLKTGPAAANCGDIITYTFAVTNTGNTCFSSGLSVADPLFGGVIFQQALVLPGQGFVFTTNYVIKPTDPANLVNTATAVGNPPSGGAVTAASSWTVRVNPCAPPPPPCVGVDKEIACAQPNNACGPLGKSATGFKGVEAPGFCYQITVTNCGPVALTNLTVVDDLLGDVTTNFFPTPATALPPGGTATAHFRLASDEDTTSTVTVSAQSAADGTPAAATDHVLAQVTAATIACQTFVTSPDDVDGHINSNVVMLPNDGAPHLVTFSLTVTNPGAADLASVTIVASTLTNLSGALPGPFALPAGTALNFTLGSMALTCPNFPVNNPVSVVGLIDTSKSGGCANDVDGNAIPVQSQCSAQVGCTNVSHGCTFTIGYYKNHPSAIGPLPIYLGTNGGVDTLIVTNQQMGVDVESQKKYGAPSNGITKLYAQLLAAKISILHGADSSVVAATITQADAFLSAYNYLDWASLSGAQQQSVLQWQTTLDSYNNGYIGPGHCSAPCQPRQQSIESQFNSQMPRGSSCIWFNAHVSAKPGQEATIYCKNASVKIVGRSGQKYTYPVPDGTIVFSASATSATTTFDGTQWTTTVPTAGDDEIFMAGLSVPMLSDFARAGSVTWQCDFTSDVAGLNLNWQWSASAYGTDLSQYGSLGVKASHNNACSTGAGFNSSDHAGTPGTVKGFLAPGCRGGGGSNYTGSWSGKDSLQLCNQSNDASDGD